MLTLIKNADVFSPQALGKCDVLVTGNHIARVEQHVDISGESLEVIDGTGKVLVPGMIDALTHPCGGGGEGGFANRTGEISAEDFIRAGITSPVGALGTDSIGRSLDVLFANVMGLRSHGLEAFMYSGSYRIPPVTLTGDLARDLVLINPVIGVGEVAIADHRSAQPSMEELRRVAADIALGGILSGKRGTVFVHVGDSDSGLGLIEEVLDHSDLPRNLFYPTHSNRNSALLVQAAQHAREGGFADITVSTTPELIAKGDIEAIDAFNQAIDAGAPAEQLTFSSDAGGSLPVFTDGELTGLTAAAPSVMLDLLRTALGGPEAEFEAILAALTHNPARALSLRSKGQIKNGNDADLLLLDSANGTLTDVFAGGKHLMREGEVLIQSV